MSVNIPLHSQLKAEEFLQGVQGLDPQIVEEICHNAQAGESVELVSDSEIITVVCQEMEGELIASPVGQKRRSSKMNSGRVVVDTGQTSCYSDDGE